jgi:septal ring-binding cell division protein DamX
MRDFEESGMGGNASARRVGALLAAVVATAVVVFSLGVMVGKRVTGTVPLITEPPATLPTETLVPPPPPDLEPPAGEREKPPPEAPPAAKAISSEKLTFFDTLSADKPSPPTLPKEPPAKVKAPPRPAPPPPAAKVKQPDKPPPVPSPPRELSQVIARLMGPGNYYVQVSSTTNRVWADDLVGKLKKKGIESTSTSVVLKGKKWYRIRIGTFADKGSARKAGALLKEKLKLDSMVVTGG